jgi:hypothetical protein
MPTIEPDKKSCSLRGPGLSANRRDSLVSDGRRASMTGRRDSVFMSLLEHAQMNRIALDEVEAGIKLKETREENALSCIGKAVCGFLVRKNICNLSYCEDLLGRCQVYMRNAPRVGIYFRFCMSFFKQHVLYFRLKNVAGLACQQFLRRCILKDFECGGVVCRQGDSCDYFYVLIEGQMTITQRLGHIDKVLGTIRSGVSFGEFGIIRQTPRTATITAAAKCSVLMIDKNSFLEILHLSNPEMVRKKTSFLVNLPIFQSAPRTVLEHLSHVMALQHWKPFDIVYRRCRFSGFDDRLLVVLSGHVDVFIEPFLSENELSQRMIKHNSRTCACYSTKALQESLSITKSWLPSAKERGRCVCECGVGSFLNIHSLFRNDSPDCCIIAGSKGATVLVVQKIDFTSIIEKGKSKQLVHALVEQSWNSMCHRQKMVSDLSFSKFPYRELVGQSLLISRPSNNYSAANMAISHMRRFLSGPRYNKLFPPLDFHRISAEQQQSPLISPSSIACAGKQVVPSLQSSTASRSLSHNRTSSGKSPRVSRAMQEANCLYPTSKHDDHSHKCINSPRVDDGSVADDCSSSIFAVPAGNSTPVVTASAKTDPYICHQESDYFERACVKFTRDLKEVHLFLRQSNRNVTIQPLKSHRLLTPRAPELPQDSRSLGVRGARMIASARSDKQERW